MRKARIFFLVLLLIGIVCVGVSSADLQIPLTLSDVPMTLPQKDVAVNFSSTNNLLRMSTNWTPQYDDFFCTVLLRSGTIVPMYRAGNDGFISYEKVTDPTLIDRVTLTSESDDGSEEVISLDREGRILSLETASASEYLEYLAETGIYRYIVNLPDTDLPLVALAATYDDNGNLLSYRVPEANNTEVTYDAAGTIVQVDALVFLEGTNTPLRITWDDAQERWYNPNTGKTVTYEAFVETEHLTPQVPTDKDADQADEASNTNGDTQEDGHTVGETESSVSPTGYLVSPPPITLNELNLKYNASDLRHLSLVKPSRSGNAVQIQDEGYSSVTLIINNTQQAMTLENGVWSSPVPDGSDYAIRLTNASGISSTYSASGVLDYSVCDSDTALILSADGIYAYDGTGRENVTATYSSDGYLATYTYRNAEDTKKVTYNPYGDVLTYQAFSADGSEYRFLSGTGWQLQQSEDTWISCEKPEDVNPSDLPPLLVLSRKKSFQNSWYPNNTAGVIGVSLRDKFPGLTDKWYHVLPVDLTLQGTQRFKMVASNLYYIGYVYVTVLGDSVTVERTYSGGMVFPKVDFFRWFTSISEITHDFLESPTDSMTYGTKYSIAEDLGGAKIGLLFVCNRVTYRQPIFNNGTCLVHYWPNIDSVKAHRQKAEEMLSNIP